MTKDLSDPKIEEAYVMSKHPPAGVVLPILCDHPNLQKNKRRYAFFKQIMPGSKKSCKHREYNIGHLAQSRNRLA